MTPLGEAVQTRTRCPCASRRKDFKFGLKSFCANERLNVGCLCNVSSINCPSRSESELPAKSSDISPGGRACSTAAAPSSPKSSLASESKVTPLPGNIVAKAFAPSSPTSQLSRLRASKRVALSAAALSMPSFKAPANASAPRGPSGFPPRCEPSTSSRTLLRRKHLAKALAPAIPIKFLSSSSRSNLSHFGSASAKLIIPLSPIRLALNTSSRKSRAAAGADKSRAASGLPSNNRANSQAPASPMLHSNSRTAMSLPAHGRTKPQATAQPISPTFCRFKTSSWQLNLSGVSSTSTGGMRPAPDPVATASAETLSALACPAVARTSARSPKTAGEARRGTRRRPAGPAPPLRPPAACSWQRPLLPSTVANICRSWSEANRQSMSNLTETAGCRSSKPMTFSKCGLASAFSGPKTKHCFGGF
mmetsp:Transcript_16340/g.57081  ORF Transcript_16340/g.57081 Transcript_16340/m.57081 type:complete len:421 (+) Transcript_16340:27-1289(+)